MIRTSDVEAVVKAARNLPSAEGNYIEDDFIMNLQETVLDYQMSTTAAVKALQHYRDNRWDEIRTGKDLEEVMTYFPEDKEGNTAFAQHLWGYNLWTRAQQLPRSQCLLRQDRGHQPGQSPTVGKVVQLQA